MPHVTFINADGTTRVVEAEVGSTLMETAIRHAIPGIVAECGGACACATCHVYIESGFQEIVAPPSSMEEDMLDFAYDVRPNSRLSCQIRIRADHDGLRVSVPDRQA